MPLELNYGKEKFAEYDNNILRFNCVKAAIAYFVDRITPQKIWIPYYYCSSTAEAVKKSGETVRKLKWCKIFSHW